MEVIDYIMLGAAAVVGVIGAIKGFIKQIFTVLGIFVVGFGTMYLSFLPNQWFESVIADESSRMLAATASTFVALGVVYAIVAKIVEGPIMKLPFMKLWDVLLGFLVGVIVVYLIFSIVIAIANGSSNTLIGMIFKPMFSNSKVVEIVYSNNFIGEWILKTIIEKLSALLPAAA